MLSLIGGNDYKELTRRILKKVITDDFAKTFSYTGHKMQKEPFNKTFVAILLISK